MQSTTGKFRTAASEGISDITQLMGRWEGIVRLLPVGWEAQARACGALVRRRGVRSEAGLLQLILAYAVGDWSLRQVGAWGTLSGVAAVSDVAILKRLRQSVAWLESLVASQLPVPTKTRHLPAVRLRLVDATALSRPGSQGTDWRVHVGLDVGAMVIDSLTLTDGQGGEGLQRFATAPGEVLVADRAYGYANSLAAVLAQGAACVVRVRWPDLATYTHAGQPFAVIEWLRRTFGVPGVAAQAIDLHLSTQAHTFAVRLVACRLPPPQVTAAQKRIRRQAQKRGVKPTAETLYVAEFVLLLTNLPAHAWSASAIGHLYRLRWQVELSFKRLKSILHLDHLRARDPQLARTYLLAKLFVALLLERLAQRVLARLPAWQADLTHPLSLWRLTAWLWLTFQLMLLLPLCLPPPAAVPDACLRRYLCNTPRKRPSQACLAHRFVHSLSVVKVLPTLC